MLSSQLKVSHSKPVCSRVFMHLTVKVRTHSTKFCFPTHPKILLKTLSQTFPIVKFILRWLFELYACVFFCFTDHSYGCCNWFCCFDFGLTVSKNCCATIKLLLMLISVLLLHPQALLCEFSTVHKISIQLVLTPKKPFFLFFLPAKCFLFKNSPKPVAAFYNKMDIKIHALSSPLPPHPV